MNYKWARDFTLQLINQYSSAGTVVPAHYNNQADYLARIPKLLDDAQMLAASTAAPILCTEPLSALRCDENGGWLVYTLPRDCREMCGAGLIRYDGEVFERCHDYHIVGANKFAVSKELGGEILVEYYRYPRLLGDAPCDTDELDNAGEVQMALPYYAAAYLVMGDDAFAFSALSNEFSARLEKFSARVERFEAWVEKIEARPEAQQPEQPPEQQPEEKPEEPKQELHADIGIVEDAYDAYGVYGV